MMMTTHFFNSTQNTAGMMALTRGATNTNNNTQGTAAISKTVA